MIDVKHCLVICTGISASGKTTYAENLCRTKGIQMLSLDDFKVEAYEEFGFTSEFERLNLRQLAICKFKAELINIMRTGNSVVVEYPFDSSWQEFFDTVSKEYKYKTIVVKFDTLDFKEIWQRRVQRDSNPLENNRHISLIASKYIKGQLFENDGDLCAEHKEEIRKQYKSGERTCLIGDIVLHK